MEFVVPLGKVVPWQNDYKLWKDGNDTLYEDRSIQPIPIPDTSYYARPLHIKVNRCASTYIVVMGLLLFFTFPLLNQLSLITDLDGRNPLFGFLRPFFDLMAQNDVTNVIFRYLPIGIYPVGRMIYHALRLVWITPYQLYHNKGNICKEIGRSLLHIVLAPLYALGMTLGLIYTLFTPYYGRKVTGFLERSWNDDVPRSQGVICLACGPAHNFPRSDPDTGSFYVFGCMQPCVFAIYSRADAKEPVFFVSRWAIHAIDKEHKDFSQAVKPYHYDAVPS